MKTEKFKNVNFHEIDEKYDDSNSLVMIGLSLPDISEREELMNSIDEWLKQMNLYTSGKLTDLRIIKTNVKESTGDFRQDVLLVFDGVTEFNPSVRLKLSNDIKWTSDFLNNYKDDYLAATYYQIKCKLFRKYKEEFRWFIEGFFGKDVMDKAIELSEENDPKLMSLLNNIWFDLWQI